MTHCGQPMVAAWVNGKVVYQCTVCGGRIEA